MLAALNHLACRKLLALLSLLSLVSTFLAPLLVHKLLPFTLGSRVLLSDSLQPLYTGELTLSNLSCFLFYTCWLRVTSLAVNPRHKIRLETAANWISPVVIMNAFFPLIFQIFLIVIRNNNIVDISVIINNTSSTLNIGFINMAKNA
ncbi:hypothetical protein GUITHDRAFT_143394 [Guillardia theta CCMP2712]|uniref:Uncharacterized protein n=1 Tax=Guillardia theta (strain CCMP2712) TaxID=905079 RepID=L1IUP2_GUITC|nr:hypothetical protein GUITHDRAFT_143394 [Guillardia theta CCMP2712]EKX39619.1 hypothetical protein GUITHDRAFT_143394 [Guillardia theta CCMP2712]|eukprot:XP_005826599.1 hypothetical protein GUITHDRAFT_143394 [Guillardia theta CCMP2712]